MQIYVERRGAGSVFSSATRRGPLTPVKTFKSDTFPAPITQPGARPVRGIWRAVSLGADGEPDGRWEYLRDEGAPRGCRWTAKFVPTGQHRPFSSLIRAREATGLGDAGELFVELRTEAFEWAFKSDDPTHKLRGQRWIAIFMRLAGHTSIDTECSCGGLLTLALPSTGQYAHVDACADCRDQLPAACPNAGTHLFCGRPDPLLTELEERMLRFETQWWRLAGLKFAAIRQEFGMSDVQFYATLNRLIDKPAAMRAFPVVVRRLQALRNRTS